jgi:hypothetical protein
MQGEEPGADRPVADPKVCCDLSQALALRLQFQESVRGLLYSSDAQLFPFARAFRIPALTRSRIKSRSSCATADTIVNSACPNALLVSMFS